MKLNVAATFLLYSIYSKMASGQQAGYLEQEGSPTITLKECTLSGGCSSKQAKLTLDANWRWVHSTSGYENCYTGNAWNSAYCSDPNQCAQNCALEGVSRQKYESTYGVQQIQDGVKLKFVTNHQHGTNVGSRLYVLDDNNDYKLFYLKNREFSFEVDVSELQCGMNGAMYFSEMSGNGGKGLGNNNAGAKYGTGYCDAQCPHDIKFISGEANVIDWSPNPSDFSGQMGAGKYGSCCAEMDIWEANSMATAYTPHPCDINGQLKCEGIDCGDNSEGERYEGVCDKDGCDINPYRMGNPDFYGRGPQYAINTLKPMKVVTQFLTTDGTDNGDLSEIRRFYVQDGIIIDSPSSTILGADDTDSITDDFCDAKKILFEDINDHKEKGGLKSMGESLDRGHVMIFSLWDDVEVNMLWLDSKFPLDKMESEPGVKRGDCPGGSLSTPEYLRDAFPNGYVTFKNAAVGEIGSTHTRPPTQPPVNPPTKSPTIPEGCYSNNYKNCLSNDYVGHDKSCNMIWLPNGAPQNACTALWGECTNGMSSCCEPATCHGDANYAYCVPPSDNDTDAPTKAPTKAPTNTPTPIDCIICDDEETWWMKNNGKDCTSSNLIDTKCNKSAVWDSSKICRLSCYNAGNGYAGDVCCNGTSASERFRRNLRTTS